MPDPEPNPWEAPSWAVGPAAPSATRRSPWVAISITILVLAWVGITVAGVTVLVRHARAEARDVHARGPRADQGSSGSPSRAGSTPLALPSALTATAPAGSRTVVTPDMARAALLAMWPVRQRIMSARQTATLPVIESGSALSGDRDRESCGCLERAMSEPLVAYRVYVARQTSWPARFVAEVHLGTVQEPFRYYLVLSRAATDQPWKVAFIAGVSFSWPQAIDNSRNDNAGYTLPVPAQDLANVTQLPALLASDYQQTKEAGMPRLDPQFLSGVWTTSFLDQIVKTSQGGQMNGSGPRLTVHYFADPDDRVDVVPLDRGRTLACGVVRQSAVYSPAHGALIQDAGRHGWPPSLSPGFYRKVTATGQLQTCFIKLSPVFSSRVMVSGGDIDAEKWYSGTK
jgi:hypothetical protein